MSKRRKTFRFRILLRLPGLLVAVAWLCLAARALELHLPTLQTKHGNFTNVVITARTDTDILIRHDGGLRNVKLLDIEDNAALIALGLKSEPLKVAETLSAADATTMTNSTPPGELRWPRFDYSAVTKKWQELNVHRPVAQVLAVILGVALLFYLFGCYCLKLICQKAGHEPGLLVWIPILQMIPALRAAGMSPWWLLASLLSLGNLVNATGEKTVYALLSILLLLINLVMQIVWCFKITAARGKHFLVAIALLLPVLNLFAFLYLAFSRAKD